MSRPVRWVVTVLAAVVAFVVCLWAARSASFDWLPKAETDRWVVATAFATLGATVVAAAVGWWAGQASTVPPVPVPAPTPTSPATPPPAGRKVTQKATASGEAQITQVGGNHNAPATPADPGPVTIRQEAKATQNSQVHQVAGDQHTHRPKP